MLTEDDIKRIHAEENLRYGFRQQLDAASKPTAPAQSPPEKHGAGKKLMDFLNSSVGMWLLSSVVLTGGAAVIQQVSISIRLANRITSS